MRHRCQFCGRWFTSELPDGYGCPNHIHEGSEALRRSIEQHNARLAPPSPPQEPER